MRIIHVLPDVGMGGGAEQSFAATAEGLVERGHELHLVVFNERRSLSLASQIEAAGVQVHGLEPHRSTVVRARAIRQIVAELQPDLVHASLYLATAPTQLGLRNAHVPVLITWTAMSYDRERWAAGGVSRWRLEGVRRIEQLLARWCPSDYQAVTEGVGRNYGRAIGVPPERIHVSERGRAAAPPLDLERRSRTRASLGLSDDSVVVLCTARQDPRKGLLRIVSCFDEIIDRVPSAHLLIAGGEGEATPSLRNSIAGARHGDRVHLLGFRSDVSDLLEASDIFAVTSHTEGACGSAIEAMARGIPIVSARLAGLEGVLVADENALIVDGDVAGSFVAPVVQLAHEPELARRIGKAGLETYENRFTVERSLDALESLYLSLVAAKGKD